ncbi:MAG: DNA-binding protein [Alcanivorax jadensis]|jgi:gp16 family phage-associated protein|uniref:DNA-binding protein n=1 Tax=Alcanivorax jadensis TaxID=64988 RepID=UPI003001A775
MATPQVLTPEQVKQSFKQRGITVTQWAEDHGYRRNAVYRVLNGADKAHYGQAHEIAVALGMKPQPENSSSQHAAA